MAILVEKNKTAELYVKFVKHNGVEATITGTPTITIKHKDPGGSIITDISADSMTSMGGAEYFYSYKPPSSAPTGKVYFASYAATYSDGSAVEGSEVFQIFPRNWIADAGRAAPGVVHRGIKQVFTHEDRNEMITKISDMNDKIDAMTPQKVIVVPSRGEDGKEAEVIPNTEIPVEMEKISEQVEKIEKLITEDKRFDKIEDMFKAKDDENQLRDILLVKNLPTETLANLLDVMDNETQGTN